MRRFIVWTIFVKELRDTLRDRRTLVVMILLPLVLYPALILGLGQLTVHQQTRMRKKLVRIALAGEENPNLRAHLERQKRLQVVKAPKGADYAKLIESRKADAVVETPVGTRAAIASGQTARITLATDDTEDASREAGRRLGSILESYRGDLVAASLKKRGLPPGVAEPIRVKRRNVASPERQGASILARTLPLLLVVMLVLGAFYPAIDLTAGEKERGTLETLLTSPVRPMEIVAGKYIAVFTLAMISGLANLVAMGLTITQGLAALTPGTGVQFQITPDRIAMIFVVLIPLALLVSGIMLAVAVLARSFKEAQNILTPTYMVMVIPSMIALLPGVKLDPITSFVPGLNATLLAKELLLGDAATNDVFIVLVANLAYTGLALAFAARNFRSESVLLGAPGSRRSLLRRARREPGGRPHAGHAFFLFGVLLVLMWYVAVALQRWDLVGGLLLSQWGLLLAPVILYALYQRFDLRATFRLRLPSWRGWAGALLVGGAMAVIIPFVVVPLQNLVLPLPTKLVESMKQFFQVSRGQMGDVGLIALVALTPAICEEAVFRGLLLDGLRSRFSKVLTAVIVGALFGAFHMSLYRFLPTALAGGFIAWVVLETGSIFTGVLMHALYNGALFGVSLLSGGEVHLSWYLALGIGLPAFAGGLWLVRGPSK